MPQNDPLTSVENIVQLERARRAQPRPNVHVARAQPAPPVLFASWVAVRDRAAAALLGGTTRVLITGPAGTGKTVLIEHVARVLRAAGRKVSIQLADADPAPPSAGVTLFVDEADRLSPAKLRELFDGAAGSVVLAGLAPLARRVAAGPVQLTLDPLDQNGAADYVAQWLFLNGRDPAELDGTAMRMLIELSGGVPRLLSTLLGAATWLAKSAGSPVIAAVHIQEAAELRSVLGPPPPPPPPLSNAVVAPVPARGRRVLWSGLLAGVVLAGVAAVSAPRLFPAETDRLVAAASPLADQVERWLRGEPTTPRVAPAPAPAPVPLAAAAPVPPVPIVRPEPPPPVVERHASAPVPAPVPAAPEPPPPAPEPPPSPPRPSVRVADVAPKAAAPDLPIETIEFLLRRGRAMLALEDLSAARLLFLRAAEGGSADAMFELGQTYDPVILTSLGAAAHADRAEALRWYRRAADKGSRAAAKFVSQP